MFNYNDLTELEKDTIKLIGDNIRVPPLEPHSTIKNRKKLYKPDLFTVTSKSTIEPCNIGFLGH